MTLTIFLWYVMFGVGMGIYFYCLGLIDDLYYSKLPNYITNYNNKTMIYTSCCLSCPIINIIFIIWLKSTITRKTTNGNNV